MDVNIGKPSQYIEIKHEDPWGGVVGNESQGRDGSWSGGSAVSRRIPRRLSCGSGGCRTWNTAVQRIDTDEPCVDFVYNGVEMWPEHGTDFLWQYDPEECRSPL